MFLRIGHLLLRASDIESIELAYPVPVRPTRSAALNPPMDTVRGVRLIMRSSEVHTFTGLAAEAVRRLCRDSFAFENVVGHWDGTDWCGEQITDILARFGEPEPEPVIATGSPAIHNDVA